VAPDAEVYAVKVLDQFGGGRISDVIEGIEWAVQNAYNAGILLVASAGNNGDGNLSTNDVMYPAKLESVIAVSAIDQNNIAVSWSADGSEVELAAPAGVSPDEVRVAMANGAIDLGVQGRDNVYGFGLVQAIGN